MNINVIINDTSYPLDIAPEILMEGQEFFEKMDRDMDRGWQMSRSWVDNPSKLQRCQIAADKLLTAIEKGNQRSTLMMAGYILYTLPEVTAVEIDTSGEMMNTVFTTGRSASATTLGVPAPVTDMQEHRTVVTRKAIHSRMDAIEQAGKDVTKVYKVGRAYRFASYDPEQQRWYESPLTKNQQEAEELRLQAYEKRLQELLQEME